MSDVKIVGEFGLGIVAMQTGSKVVFDVLWKNTDVPREAIVAVLETLAKKTRKDYDASFGFVAEDV